jgi:hypothetical protein
LIEEAGYKEQASSYQLKASASRMAADADDKAASGSTWSAWLKGAAAVGSLFTGGASGPFDTIGTNIANIGLHAE